MQICQTYSGCTNESQLPVRAFKVHTIKFHKSEQDMLKKNGRILYI